MLLTSLCLALGFVSMPTKRATAENLLFPTTLLDYVTLTDETTGQVIDEQSFEEGKNTLNQKTFMLYLSNDLRITPKFNSGEYVLSVFVDGSPLEMVNITDPQLGNVRYFLVDNQSRTGHLPVEIILRDPQEQIMFDLRFSLISMARFSSVLDYISISQDGYDFSASDFVIGSIDSLNVFMLYSNKTVTISENYKKPEPAEGEEPLPDPTISLQVRFDNNDITEESEQYREINGKKYYFADISKITTEKPYTRIYLRLIVNEDTYEIVFYLVQTNLKLNNGHISWTNISSHETFPAPNENGYYSPLSISIPNGSPLNPVYIKFTYCGQIYTIYNIGDGKFYNTADISDPDAEPLDFDTMVFDVSGRYVVEVYDNTINSNYSDNNYHKYIFNIINNAGGLSMFYFNAHLEDGEPLVSGQYANEPVILEFENIDSFREQIRLITVTRDYRYSLGEQHSDTVTYGGRSLGELNDQLVFTNYGTYTISMEVNSFGRTETRSFTIRLINDIKLNFQFRGQIYTIGDTEPSNVTKSVDLQETIACTYEGSCRVESSTTYDFHVLLARSSPSINGISNNDRTSKNVSLTVYGVGKLSVSITQDGKTYTREYANGDRLPTFSDPGKYFIKLTDEMGYTITKSFTISVQMNTAAIILIAIAAALIVFIIVFIILSRSKVKVR